MPHNREERTTLSGRLPETLSTPAPAPIEPETGMHKDYWILSDAERVKGFVRPVRNAYMHTTCGYETIMADKLAETYACDPKFYGATFCSYCKEHRPVAEFNWRGTEIKVGT